MVDATHKNGKIGDGGSYCCTSITWGLSEDLRGPPKFYGCIKKYGCGLSGTKTDAQI